MKTLLKILAVALGLVSIGAQAHAPARVYDPSPITGLTGTWRVTVSTYDCATLVQNPSFKSLLTFNIDGTMIETTSAPLFQPGQRTSGYGYWYKTGRNFYRAVSEAFIQFSTPPVMGPPLSRGSQRIEQGIEFQDRNHWTSEATTSFSDESGTVVLAFCAAATGERMD
ncbi:MAG TPA: hypothetical protein VE046_06535 [Steroidobacteraceae bacterium]|nr:hypothetical protein [Steroidobacteraceae bacterium]